VAHKYSFIKIMSIEQPKVIIDRHVLSIERLTE
jgi:hypothetical protein